MARIYPVLIDVLEAGKVSVCKDLADFDKGQAVMVWEHLQYDMSSGVALVWSHYFQLKVVQGGVKQELEKSKIW